MINFVTLSDPSLFKNSIRCSASGLAYMIFSVFSPKLRNSYKLHKKFNYSNVPNSSACTFINFDEKIHPARSYLGLHVYWFWQNFPPCTFITPCTFIGLYYKFFTVVTFLQAKQSKQSYNGYLLTFILQSLKYFSCQIIFHYIFVICTQNYAPLLIFWK